MTTKGNPEWATFGERLKWARANAKPKKMTQEALAAKSGVKQPTISDIERGDASSSGATSSLAAALRVNALWLESNRGLPYDVDTRAAQAGGSVHYAPVSGDARLGPDQLFDLQEVVPGSEGYVMHPGDEEGYALRCFGDSMRPSIQPGYFVVIQPKHKPAVGDLVSCETRDGRRMIKILNRRRDGMLELTSINSVDYGPITIDEDEVAHLHYAIGPITPQFHQPDRG